MKKKRVIIPLALVMVVALIGGVTGCAVTRNSRSITACEKTLTAAQSARRQWEKTLTSPTVAQARKITASQVKDGKTVTLLTRTVSTRPRKVESCPTKGDATQTTRRLEGTVAWYEAQSALLTSQAKRVVASQRVKLVEGEQAQVKELLVEARKLYDSSQGKASDESRKRLLDSIRKAQKGGSSLQMLRQVKRGLSQAMSGVSSSQKAEEERKADEAQRKAQKTPAVAPRSSAPKLAPKQTTPKYQRTTPKPAPRDTPSRATPRYVPRKTAPRDTLRRTDTPKRTYTPKRTTPRDTPRYTPQPAPKYTPKKNTGGDNAPWLPAIDPKQSPCPPTACN